VSDAAGPTIDRKTIRFGSRQEDKNLNEKKHWTEAERLTKKL
jgi:hypothetical protein